MTLDEFIAKYLGKEVDYDGVWDGQCVDLYRFYVRDVLGFEQSVPVGGAADIWHTAQAKYYDFIAKELTAVPQKGDIVIWNRNAGGGFGHVAIFLEGDVNSFTSLDQNWPTLSVVTKTKHNYNNIIGWLRPKGEVVMSNMYKGLDLTNIESMKVAVNVWADVRDGKYVAKEVIANLQNDLNKKDKEIDALNKTVTSGNAILIEKLAKKDLECQTALTNQKSEFIQSEKNLKEQYKLEIEGLNNIIKELKKAKPELVVEEQPKIHTHPEWLYTLGWAKK